MFASRPPSLRTVAAFEAAARHENFAKAAAELNLTESAISHAVRSLEDQLRVRLFDRVGRSVALNAEGRRVARRFRMVLVLLGKGAEPERPGDLVPELSLCAPPGFAARVVLPAWAEFEERCGRVSLSLFSAAQGQPASLAGADVSVRFGSWEAGPCISRQMTRESLVAVAGPSWAGAGIVGDGLPLIEHEDHPWAEWFAQSGQGSPDGPPRLTVRCFDLALEAARAGVGACLAPASLVQGDINAGSLVLASPSQWPLQQGYVAEWRAETPKQALVEAFVDWLSGIASARQAVSHPSRRGAFPRVVAG